MRTVTIISVFLSLAVISPSALSQDDLETIVYDHFDDGVLDPAWDVIFDKTKGWTYEETGTDLIVTDIDPDFVPWNPGEYTVVRLKQDCPPLGDIHVTFDFAWDSESSTKAMQNLWFFLYDSDNKVIAGGGYTDGWISHYGTQYLMIGNDYYIPGVNTLPQSGKAVMSIDREGEEIVISWDGTPEFNGISCASVESMEIIFRFKAYDGPLGKAFFGMESVDLLHVEGEALNLSPDRLNLNASIGGEIDFTLYAGQENAKRDYILLSGISGTDPGTLLPGGMVTLPVNWDLFTSVVVEYINTTPFQNFMGTLFLDGSGIAYFNTLGPLPHATVGLTFNFAYALNKPWDFVSNPVGIEIVP